jgi:hypothetical protein
MSYALDAALEVVRPIMLSEDSGNALVAAKCFGLLQGYDARWANSPYRIDGVEAVLTSDLVNPETERKSRSFIVAGKLDVRATEIATGSKVIIDHKSCSQDITDPLSPYWQQLVIEGQVTHYQLLEWLNANKVDAAVWDVMRKPGISPKALTKADKKSIQDGEPYFGLMVNPEVLTEDFREPPMMYARRLAHDCTVERPQWYFQRRQIPRLDSEVREYAIELWGHGQDILAARNADRWPRNGFACMTYGTPCEYLGLCSNHDTLDSGNWTTKPYVHNELPIIGQGDGKDVLTNSRIRTFQTCRRKHQLKYEMGIERTDKEEREALYFGTLYHLALEQYFIALQKQQKG